MNFIPGGNKQLPRERQRSRGNFTNIWNLFCINFLYKNLIFHIFQNIAEVKGCETIFRGFLTADQLYASIGF